MPPKSCFVIAPIGAPDSETRKKSDQVLKYIIRKALEPDYAVERADEITRPGVITVQIVQRVFEADLVVADLTGRNPNVYYELAIRHATQKPAVHLIAAGEDLPFDVQEMRVVPYDLTNPDSIEEAGSKLHEYVQAIEGGEAVLTPVQLGQIVASLEVNAGRDEQILAAFKTMSIGLSNLQTALGEILLYTREQKQKDLYQLWAQSTLIAPQASPPGVRVSPRGIALSPPPSGFTVADSGLKFAEHPWFPSSKAAAAAATIESAETRADERTEKKER